MIFELIYLLRQSKISQACQQTWTVPQSQFWIPLPQLKDPSLQDEEIEMRNLLDWDYYLERIGNNI